MHVDPDLYVTPLRKDADMAFFFPETDLLQPFVGLHGYVRVSAFPEHDLRRLPRPDQRAGNARVEADAPKRPSGHFRQMPAGPVQGFVEPALLDPSGVQRGLPVPDDIDSHRLPHSAAVSKGYTSPI